MNNYLETAISLILIFFIFSVITYVIQELVAVNLQYRGKVLWQAIAQLLDNFAMKGRKVLTKDIQQSHTQNTHAFFNHPQIQSLQKNLNHLPSYIPATNFALAIIDVIASQAPADAQNEIDVLNKVRKGLTVFVQSNGNIGTIIKNLADTSTSIQELQQKIEQWYTMYMDRVTGWYKSHTLITLRLIALGVTLFFNIDAVYLTKQIYNNAQLRSSMVTIAERITDHPETASEFYTKSFDQTAKMLDSTYQTAIAAAGTDSAKAALRAKLADEKTKAADLYTKKRIQAIDSLSQQLNETDLPIGWQSNIHKAWDDLKNRGIIWVILGWLIAAGCLSMGAPFWFDLLVKLVNVRRAGIKPGADDKRDS